MKENDNKKSLKEMWKDPQKKAIIKLGLWFFFFAFVFLFLTVASLFNHNNSKNNDTNPILSGADVDNDERETYYRYFYKQLEIEIMRQRYPMDGDVLSALVDILVDSVCSKRKTIRIAGDDKPINVVKSQFMKLNSSHVEYVMDSLKSNTTKIRNIKQYILATLYNAPLTMSSYYQAEVLHDFPQFAKKN